MDTIERPAALRERWPAIVNVIAAQSGERVKQIPVLGFVCFDSSTTRESALQIVREFLQLALSSADLPAVLSDREIGDAQKMAHISCWGVTFSVIDSSLVAILSERGYFTRSNRMRLEEHFKQASNEYGALSPEVIIQRACRACDVTEEDLLGPCRDQDLVLIRHCVAFLLRQVAGLKLKQIGRLLGGRDHSSIMHAVRRISKMVENDELGVRSKLRRMMRGWPIDKKQTTNRA